MFSLSFWVFLSTFCVYPGLFAASKGLCRPSVYLSAVLNGPLAMSLDLTGNRVRRNQHVSILNMGRSF